MPRSRPLGQIPDLKGTIKLKTVQNVLAHCAILEYATFQVPQQGIAYDKSYLFNGISTFLSSFDLCSACNQASLPQAKAGAQ